MGDRSRIEWTDASWTPIRARSKATGKVGWHCTHVSEGCRNCYAEGMNLRLGTGLAYKPGHAADLDVFLDEKMLLQPLRWRRPRLIFVGSMTDLFADFVTDAMLDRIFAVMAIAPQHTFQVLTKRPERMRAYLGAAGAVARLIATLNAIDKETPAGKHAGDPNVGIGWNAWAAAENLKLGNAQSSWPHWPLRNVWLGTSCEDQAAANLRVADLIAAPAAVRFLSAEPLLGPIDLAKAMMTDAALQVLYERAARGEVAPEGGSINWVIVGGESGTNARPMHPAWPRAIRDQCAAAGVAFHFKQHGEWSDTHPDWPRATPTAMADDGTLYQMADLAYPDGPRRGEAIRAGHDKAQLTSIYRVGKKAAGRLLDGVEHNGMPHLASPVGSKRPRLIHLRRL